ncbi:MAG: hypothetical protein PHG34_02355 [Candidatus Cloacimonetes bacterium]|nr:hypothetical protein [Candidatus Cloacimonadota bacterium]
MFTDLMKQQRGSIPQTTVRMGGKISRILSSTAMIVTLLILGLSFSACKGKPKETPNKQTKQEVMSNETKKISDTPDDSSQATPEDSDKPDGLQIAATMATGIQADSERYMPADYVYKKIAHIQRGVKTNNLLLLIAVILLALILAIMAWKTFFMKSPPFVWENDGPPPPRVKKPATPKQPWKWEDK